jgi:hypothetical protein
MGKKQATNATWSAPAPADTVYHRAGGRRRYNAQRGLAAMVRRIKVAQLVLQEKAAVVVPKVKPDYAASMHRALVAIGNRGMQARIARELGVSASTVCRDLKRLKRELGIWPATPDAMSQVREMRAEAFRRDEDAEVRDASEADDLPVAAVAPARPAGAVDDER